MAELIATGTTLANSADVVVAAGTPATVFLKDATGQSVDAGANALIQIKSAGGEYFDIGALTSKEPALAITSPGTFRIVRPVQAVAVGVDQS